MKNQLVFGVVLILTTMMAGVSTADELIQNGSFEEGLWNSTDSRNSYTRVYPGSNTLTGWNIAGGDGVDWHNTTEFSPILNASGVSDTLGHAVDLNFQGPSGSILSQSFATTQNEWYTLKFSMAAPDDAGIPNRQVKVAITGMEDLFYSMPSAYNLSLNWQNFSLDFKALGDSTTLAFSSMNGHYWGPALDHVSVSSAIVTPEPVSSVLFLFGGGVLLLRRSMKNKA